MTWFGDNVIYDSDSDSGSSGSGSGSANASPPAAAEYRASGPGSSVVVSPGYQIQTAENDPAPSVRSAAAAIMGEDADLTEADAARSALFVKGVERGAKNLGGSSLATLYAALEANMNQLPDSCMAELGRTYSDSKGTFRNVIASGRCDAALKDSVYLTGQQSEEQAIVTGQNLIKGMVIGAQIIGHGECNSATTRSLLGEGWFANLIIWECEQGLEKGDELYQAHHRTLGQIGHLWPMTAEGAVQLAGFREKLCSIDVTAGWGKSFVQSIPWVPALWQAATAPYWVIIAAAASYSGAVTTGKLALNLTPGGENNYGKEFADSLVGTPETIGVWLGTVYSEILGDPTQLAACPNLTGDEERARQRVQDFAERPSARDEMDFMGKTKATWNDWWHRGKGIPDRTPLQRLENLFKSCRKLGKPVPLITWLLAMDPKHFEEGGRFIATQMADEKTTALVLRNILGQDDPHAVQFVTLANTAVFQHDGAVFWARVTEQIDSVLLGLSAVQEVAPPATQEVAQGGDFETRVQTAQAQVRASLLEMPSEDATEAIRHIMKVRDAANWTLGNAVNAWINENVWAPTQYAFINFGFFLVFIVALLALVWLMVMSGSAAVITANLTGGSALLTMARGAVSAVGGTYRATLRTLQSISGRAKKRADRSRGTAAEPALREAAREVDARVQFVRQMYGEIERLQKQAHVTLARAGKHVPGPATSVPRVVDRAVAVSTEDATKGRGTAPGAHTASWDRDLQALEDVKAQASTLSRKFQHAAMLQQTPASGSGGYSLSPDAQVQRVLGSVDLFLAEALVAAGELAKSDNTVFAPLSVTHALKEPLSEVLSALSAGSGGLIGSLPEDHRDRIQQRVRYLENWRRQLNEIAPAGAEVRDKFRVDTYKVPQNVVGELGDQKQMGKIFARLAVEVTLGFNKQMGRAPRVSYPIILSLYITSWRAALPEDTRGPQENFYAQAEAVCAGIPSLDSLCLALD